MLQAQEKKEALAARKANCRRAIRAALWRFEINIAVKDLSLLLIHLDVQSICSDSIFLIDVQKQFEKSFCTRRHLGAGKESAGRMHMPR